MKFFIRFLASGGFAGHLPAIPGTWGTLVAVALYWPLARWSGEMAPVGRAAVYGGATFVLIGVAVVVSDLAERRVYGRKDPGAIVIDEMAGFLVTMAGLPVRWGWVGAGFVLFRAFDVIKPWPIRRLQALPGGVGVVADDLLAGLYACGLLHLGRWALSAAG